VAVPEVSATPAGEMTATMTAVAAPGKVTTTVATSAVTTTVASAVTATTMAAATCLGRHIGCGHHQTGGSDSRETINPSQGSNSE
jgi:hypothetical protein